MSEAREKVPGTALAAPADNEIEKIRVKGAAMVAYRREVNELYRQIEGLEWGSGSSLVRGDSFSPHTRYALAQFCRITRANPITHVDILGGKPYLNARYWSDRLNSDPYFHHLDQREISEATEDELRRQASERREAYEAMKPHDVNRAAQELSKALDLEADADDIARARQHYRVPEWATCAYETVIVRFINAAPMEKIRAGEVPAAELERWLTEVRECNWAGNRPRKEKSGGGSYDPDPIGNEEPEKTARTRSLRRAGARAFPAWMQGYDEQIRKAEHAIEVEWEEIQDERLQDRRAIGSGEQAARIRAGEPERAPAAEAEELPGTVGATPREPSGNGSGEEEPAEEPDRDTVRKMYFASLRDAGISGDKDRKAWQGKWLKSFPASTTEWTLSQFRKAVELLIEPVRERYREGCRVLQVDEEDYALRALGRLPETVGEYRELVEQLNAEADAAFAEQEGQ